MFFINYAEIFLKYKKISSTLIIKLSNSEKIAFSQKKKN